MPPEKSPTQPYLTGRPACHSLSCPWGLTNGPHTLGRQSRGESKIERPHMSLQLTPEMATRVGLIIQGWTCTCMQRNTRTINANHWMEVNTSGGMDELVTWIKGPTFRMKERPTDLKPPWESNTMSSITQWWLIQRLGRKSQAGRPHFSAVRTESSWRLF